MKKDGEKEKDGYSLKIVNQTLAWTKKSRNYKYKIGLVRQCERTCAVNKSIIFSSDQTHRWCNVLDI